MSEVRVNNIVDYGGKGAPTFDNGAVISGVSSLGNQAKIGSNVTITSGGINVSGVTTAATLSGNLTGDVNSGFVTATSAVIGSGVTINAGGLNITGVVTATTFEGSGANMTGVAMTITPLAYNPDVNDSIITPASGIGITFDHRILAGSGNVTLSIANAGVAGTVVENFGVGSSVTIQGRKAIIDPTSDLNFGETYHISYPSGAFTNTGGDVSYVGTAYTFGVKALTVQLWAWGNNEMGFVGQNNRTSYSSPVQIPGTTWSPTRGDQFNTGADSCLMTKTDGTMWAWGIDYQGSLGLNNPPGTYMSSPTQIPGTNWTVSYGGNLHSLAVKDDGTLWAWGRADYGQTAQNDRVARSSPTQIPGTTWDYTTGDSQTAFAKKTDGTLWCWGNNEDGGFGNNESQVVRSSPVQIPGTWSGMKGMSHGGNRSTAVIKSDSTLWIWGRNDYGNLGQNERTQRSSPVQVPGTTWKEVEISEKVTTAIKTDGTLWSWGFNDHGALGQNQALPVAISSPTQIGSGTDWDKIGRIRDGGAAIKTDGSLYAWGRNNDGQLGQNSRTYFSSPVQITGDWNSFSNAYSGFGGVVYGLRKV